MVHEHIREARDDELETSLAGLPLSETGDFEPPCNRETGAFSSEGYWITHNDPLNRSFLKSTREFIPPHSVCTTPYGEMLKRRGRGTWEMNPDVQTSLLEDFFDDLEPGKSLVFFYVNHGNPLIETVDRPTDRVVVGVGRLKSVGRLQFFEKDSEEHPDYPVWSRIVTHDFPQEGFRLPYQEYLDSNQDPSEIVCSVPDTARPEFRYVAEHVSDDTAVSILERLAQSVERILDDGIAEGPWRRHLNWLGSALSDVWTNRGPFPGIGSVLCSMKYEKGHLFHRMYLSKLLEKGSDIRKHVLELLEDRAQIKQEKWKEDFDKAVWLWSQSSESRKDLLKFLFRFELTPAQVVRVVRPERRWESGIVADETEIMENPYLLSEQDLGTEESPPIGFEIVDHGMIPSDDVSKHLDPNEIIQPDDKRRVRALLVEVLRSAARDGDTFLHLDEALGRVRKWLPGERICDPDREMMLPDLDFYNECLDLVIEDEYPRVALRQLRTMEQEVSTQLLDMVDGTHPSSTLDWESRLREEFGPSGSADESEARARVEKAQALETMYTSRFCVLTGRAGTGKTTLIKLLLKGIEDVEGAQPSLLLAPTGKARVRLGEKTQHEALTIHQLLASLNWLRANYLAFREEGGEKRGAATVVVDECSMVPMDLMGTLFRALDFNFVKRLVLLGDPNQLPPIGSGRPFVDIIAWLETRGSRCLARLVERGRFKDRKSQALRLSDAYVGGEVTPHDDEMLSRIAKGDITGDLEVHFWNTPEDLKLTLFKRLYYHLEISGDDDYGSFNESLGITSGGEVSPEKWQVLSPLRGHPFGTREINRWVQSRFRGGLIRKSRMRRFRPFGNQEITWLDKIIQMINERRKTTDGTRGYVANGEVGIVTNTLRSRGGSDRLRIRFGSQKESEYDYYRGEVDEKMELAYAITVHKAQGSDFNVVFVVIPQKAATLSKELLYTSLTRFRDKLILLIEKDTEPLHTYRSPEMSVTLSRNTNLFTIAGRPDTVDLPHPDRLIHKTETGVLVRSKSEVVVANILTSLGLSYEYEKRLESKEDPNDYRMPDFTVYHKGERFIWEHLGMLSSPSYLSDWRRKEKWYDDNGYLGDLITSKDDIDGGIDSEEIKRIAQERILESNR